MWLQEKEGKSKGLEKSLGKRQGEREDAWYRKSEHQERAGKKVEIIQKLSYQSYKYNLLIDIYILCCSLLYSTLL